MDSKRIFSDLRNRLIQEGKSPKTYDSYAAALRIFFDHFPTTQHPTHVNESEIIEFLASVRQGRGPFQERACFWALLYLYKNIEYQPHKMDRIKAPKVSHKIEIPPSGEEILSVIDGIRNVKHKAIIQLLFSTGLRLSEAAGLELQDIDSKNMVIHVRFGKGNTSRLAPLHPVLLETLRSYIVDARRKNRTPVRYLFESDKTRGNHISTSAIYRICRQYAKVRTHLLRHAFATEFHKLEKDLLPLRDILGHRNTRTTEIYLHYDPQTIRMLRNPLDGRAKAA